MLYSNNQIFLAKQEVTEGTDPTPTAAANAIQAGKIMPGYSFTQIQRLALNRGINAIKKMIGLEVVDLQVNVDLKNSGTATTEAEWGVLLEACGYKKTTFAAKTVEAAPEANFGNTLTPATLTVSAAGTYTPTVPKRYIVTVSTGGASGVAKVDIVCPDDATENTTGTTVTTATPINLGTGGGTITFTFSSGNLVLNDAWTVFCQVPGFSYKPNATTDTWKTVYCYLYIDGLLWKVSSCRGDFNLKIEAGVLASINFKLRGVFCGVTDVAVPVTVTYQSSVTPVIVESAGASFDVQMTRVIRSVSLDSVNNLQQRNDINSPKGIKGWRPGVRDPRFTLRLEAELEATEGIWAKLAARTEFPLDGKVGSVSGNIIDYYVRRAAIDTPAPADENDLLVYDPAGQCLPLNDGSSNIEIFTR